MTPAVSSNMSIHHDYMETVLVDFMRPASEPQEAIDLATKAFREGVQDAATWILDAAKGTDIGDLISEKLRQPWPTFPVKPSEKKKDIDQEKADHNARAQTARMTAAILINALAYQQNLAGYSAEVEIEEKKVTHTIKSLAQIRKPTGLHQDDVLAEWDNILCINYWPIFHIAKLLLTIRTRSDDIHHSGSQLSVHGWWETVSSTGCPSKADVNVQLQGLMCQSYWGIEVCWWETIQPDGEDDANLWPGGGSGKRVTGRSDCASNIGTGFRSVVDVDLVGIWDPSQKLESAGEELQCRPPEPYS